MSFNLNVQLKYTGFCIYVIVSQFIVEFKTSFYILEIRDVSKNHFTSISVFYVPVRMASLKNLVEPYFKSYSLYHSSRMAN